MSYQGSKKCGPYEYMEYVRP
uniref:Uncharacterized protein n=1 Tax=Arundo donax TaxID=35708 RepID=A0A0A9ATC9_ARUDO